MAARRGPPRREGGAACGGGNARAARMSDGAANCARRSSEVSLHTSPSRTRSTPSRNSRPPTPPNGAHHRGTRSGRRRSPTTAASIGRRHQTTGQPAGRPVAPLASGRLSRLKGKRRLSLLEGKHPPQQRHALTSYPISYGDPRLAASRSQIVHRIRVYQRPEDPNDADKRGFRYISGQFGSKQGG